MREAAEQLGISYKKGLDLVHSRELESRQIGSMYRIPLAAIGRYLGEDPATAEQSST